MKGRALLQHLTRHGCALLREGARHSVDWNPANGNATTVPRHTEIADRLAMSICKDLGIPAP